MKRYWDYDEKERAELTEEQVRELLDYELMEKGVLKVPALSIEVPRPVDIPTRKVFTIQVDAYTKLGVAFDTIEAAQSFLALKPMMRVESYAEKAHCKPLDKATVAIEDLPSESDVATRRQALRENQKIEARNVEAKHEHDAALMEIDEATSGIWADWRSCLAAKAKREKVSATFGEYKRLTDGNEGLARTFLAKVFSSSEIADALGDGANAAA